MQQFIPEKFSKFIPGKKLAIGLTLGALVIGGTAWAAQAAHSRADANGDGVVTREESQTLAAQRFAMLDVNKDGKLDPADRAARGQMAFAAIDTDKNGQISQTEFDAARMQRLDARSADGRGGGRGGHGRGDWGGGGHGGNSGGFGHRDQAAMALADSNKDGAISQAEFIAVARQRFDLVDSDKNGQLSSAERIAARMTMRSKWQAAPAAPATPK
jgi:EF hand